MATDTKLAQLHGEFERLSYFFHYLINSKQRQCLKLEAKTGINRAYFFEDDIEKYQRLEKMCKGLAKVIEGLFNFEEKRKQSLFPVDSKERKP